MESVILEQEKSKTAGASGKRFGISGPAESVEKPIRQYLYFAFRRSLRDAETYETSVSAIFGDDERSVFFREMADRKQEEAEKLYSYYKTDGYRIIRDMKKRSIISHPHYRIPMHDPCIESIEDIYSFAYKNELKTFELYSKLAKLDSNPYTKILFDYLAHLQTEHIAFIEKKFSLVDLRTKDEPRLAAAL